ncbi:flagellar filament capping protein FliD [Planomonospora sp. ID82291]|uniref:flagellar filament capping protein FliD n=1 Tax=Planomonospora sp. ID82291 TaxID=2738136 RepID=UPI0018C36095|nr:flagellar filament capping protein FliD [Planomonospora sp. ID82291]MBG0818569.1 flagellar filament capping protein FliD [Planomonospora sp. ID82291]
MVNSIDGLVSGMSTSSLISQLMQVESAPQTKLRSKVSAQEKVQSAYQAINTKLAALKTAADAMFADATWTSSKASSSSTAVTATTAAGAPPAALTFNVDELARAQVSTAVFGSAAGPALDMAGGITGVSIKIGTGDPVDIAVAADKNTPQGIADAINAKKLDVRATVVTTADGPVLQLSSAKTGTAAAFGVVGVARATSSFAAATDPAVADPDAGVDITVGAGAPVNVKPVTNTPQGLADAINGSADLAALGVTAKITTVSGQGPKLEIVHSKTGTAETMQVSGLTVGPAVTRTGFGEAVNVATSALDAQITVGSGAGSYTVTSATNSFTGVMQGVTLNVSKKETGVTVTNSLDTDAITGKMKSFVDAANSVLSEISGQTSYNSISKTKQPLTGNFGVRQIAQTILGQTGNGQSGYGSFAQIGVQLDKTGKLTFNQETFLKAYTADPDKVRKAVTATDPVVDARVDAQGKPVPKTEVTAVMGLAEKLGIIASNSTANLTSAIKGGESLLKDLNQRIGAWDLRLEKREEALRKQFTGLEVALGKMNQQSSWLAGQINSLPKIENGS